MSIEILSPHKPIPDNDSHPWNKMDPRDYAAREFGRLNPVDIEVLKEMNAFFEENPPGNTHLEVGTGPGLHYLLFLLPRVQNLYVVEYGKQNVDYLNEQKEKMEETWQKWIDHLRELNPGRYVGYDFQQALKDKLIVFHGSLFDLLPDVAESATMHSTIESATTSMGEFTTGIDQILRATRKNSPFFFTFIENSSGWQGAQGVPLPGLSVNKDDIIQVLSPRTTNLKVIVTNAEVSRPNEHIVAARGRRLDIFRRAIST